MTRALYLGLALLAAACGDKSPESICSNQVPPPAACMTACNPAPTAANSCPTGFHCSPEGKCDASCTAAGGQCGDNSTCTDDGRCIDVNTPCTGLQCAVVDCAAKNMPPTTISGTVFAPNGTLPLFGVSVYVPNKDPGAFKPGVACGSCANGLPGEPIVTTTTDDKGNFSLQGVPSGANIPVVITIGKWRRQLTVSSVASCATQAMDPTETRLPASKDDTTPNTKSVDLPLIAISTGHADSLECLMRRLGIADKEITTDTQGGRIHLYSDTKATTNVAKTNGVGTSSFAAAFAGGTGTFSDSKTLWGTAADPGKLKDYDIVILSCEGAQHAETKPQAAMDHLKAYADIGGRVFLSHWHNVWLEGTTQDTAGAKPAVWDAIASFEDNVMDPGNGTKDTIDENPTNNPKGVSFANWMLNVQKDSPVRDQVTIADGTAKRTAKQINDPNKAERWVYLQTGTEQVPQNFQFTTPNEVPLENRCGKVVFSDMHVSDSPILDSNKNVLPYPSSCASRPPPPADQLTDQEKALAFMFFDISSCVGVLF